MSMFFMPHELMPDAKAMEANLEKLTRDMAAFTPREFGGDGSFPLFAAPLAFAAFGASVAGQAFGAWLAVVRNSMEAAQAFSEAQPSAKTAVAEKARSAVEKIVEDAAQAMSAAVADMADSVTDTSLDALEVAAEVVEDASGPVQPEAIARPELPDDLKKIAGVGPKLEKVLNDLGIWTYSQVARLTEAEILWLDARLGFKGRIARDKWLDQARGLVTPG